MGLADELSRLDELRSRGVLTEAEFERAKAQVLAGLASPAAGAPVMVAANLLRRSRSDRWIGGVCGGLALVSGLESWIWRLLFLLLLMFGGTGLLVYLLLWIFVPSE
ncbi:MAG: PspC domain-containing protein [Rubrivivax sp.]|nr:PspC domain-containing protein [Rubrivivax sp.]